MIFRGAVMVPGTVAVALGNPWGCSRVRCMTAGSAAVEAPETRRFPPAAKILPECGLQSACLFARRMRGEGGSSEEAAGGVLQDT